MTEIVYAIMFTIVGSLPDGGLALAQSGPPQQMTIEQCLKEAADINYAPNTQAVMVCAPVNHSNDVQS